MTPAPHDVGVVGLGPMGQALVEALIAAGHSVSAYDIDADAVARAARRGATPAIDARQVAAGTSLVITVLPGSQTVIDVALDPQAGIVAGIAPGSLLLDMSTAGPDIAPTVAQGLASAGAVFVDAPVSGRAPTMTVLLGGADGVLGVHEPIIRAVSGQLIHCGRLGAGYATKLLNQHIKYARWLAASEALVLAGRLGLDPAQTAAALELCTAANPGLADAAEWFRGDERAIAGHGPVRTIAKDMALAHAMAQGAEVAVPTLDLVADFFAEVAGTPLRERPFPESAALLKELRLAGTVAR